MRGSKAAVIAGFAMFSMFFGSGNLVFPLSIGVQAMDKAPWAIAGLLISGVLVPFLGLVGVLLYKGSRIDYLACIGKVPAFLLSFSMLALMGPFAVIPRCILVSHGGIKLLAPNMSFALFALLFCALILVLVWKHDRIVPILGKILTPWKLGGIVLITIAGLMYGPKLQPSIATSSEVFWKGLRTGYQMMDLLAAFFFSATAVAYLHKYLGKHEKPSELLRLGMRSMLIGAGILGTVYIGFILLGAKFSTELHTVNQEQYLVAIAKETMGFLAIPIAGFTILLSCLTTATILTMLFSDFLNDDILKKKFKPHTSLIVTLLISFFVSMVGFPTLVAWLDAILTVAYPALIALTIGNIVNKLWKIDYSKWAFWMTFFGSLTLFVSKKLNLSILL